MLSSEELLMQTGGSNNQELVNKLEQSGMRELTIEPGSFHCKCDWTNIGAKQGFSQHTADVST